MLLCYPDCPQGEKRDGIVESIDLFPTLCELADVPTPETGEGDSLIPVTAGKSAGKKEALCE